jgi:hypothetical protein
MISVGLVPANLLYEEEKMARFRKISKVSLGLRALGLILMVVMLQLQGCGPSAVAFGVKHIRDQAGEQIPEIVSYEQYPGLDNSKGTSPLQVQLEFKRSFRYQMIVRMTSNNVPEQKVREKIVELYKLPPNDPEGTVQKAQCPIVVVVPEGQKAKVTVEWTERWAEGVINEGAQGEGNRLGTYRVFLGYIEPCSLVKQDNIK